MEQRDKNIWLQKHGFVSRSVHSDNSITLRWYPLGDPNSYFEGSGDTISFAAANVYDQIKLALFMNCILP